MKYGERRSYAAMGGHPRVGARPLARALETLTLVSRGRAPTALTLGEALTLLAYIRQMERALAPRPEEPPPSTLTEQQL